MKFIPLLATLALTFPAASAAADPQDSIPSDQLAFFESKIRPVLAERCYECHSAETGKSKGGLTLDTRVGIRAGGDTGPSIVPGKIGESLLIEAISYTDEDLEMPPKKQLPAGVVEDFKKWVAMGAPDPRGGDITLARTEIDVEEGRNFWAFKKPHLSVVPQVENASWPRSETDRFVLAKLESEKLSPAPDADPHTLVRRLHFDLTGLPPSPVEVENFVALSKFDLENAIEKEVDRLLASPRFGERWARHWLDVARYAESTGKEANQLFPHAWRYRDYVIDSFNDDKPFDQFVLEQLAGDLLPYDDYPHQAELLTATGFLALGPKSLNENNPRQFAMDVVDEQIDVTTRAFLATTVACARCHDHKFDPIPATDYYALAGIFLSSETYYGTVAAQGNRRSSDLLYLSGVDRSAIGESFSAAEIAGIESQLERLKEQRADLISRAREARKNGDDFNNGLLLRLVNQVNTLQARLDAVDESGRPFAVAMGMWDRESGFDSPVLIRGELDKRTEPVPRGFVQVICDEDQHELSRGVEGSGRLEMARWIASDENPLTARVFVNRVWHHLFGTGIVRSVDNFGASGETPSHPELLDNLAIQFAEDGWSLKELVRKLVLTRTYRQSSGHDPAKLAADPENRLLSHMPKRRLEAEAIRDALLAVSGNLELTFPHGSPVAFAGDGAVGRNVAEAQLAAERDHNRSVFLPVVRDLLPDAMEVFDFPDPSLPDGDRDTTNVPSQSLYLMNSEFVLEQADSFAKRVSESASEGPAKLAYAFMLAYARPPTAAEVQKTTAYFERFTKAAMADGLDEDRAAKLALTTYCQSLLASAEFRYLD